MTSVLQRLWSDRMDVYRWSDKKEGKITKQEKAKVLEGIKCHYCKGSLSDTGENGVPTLINSYSLFCGPGVDLREGDEVVVTQRNGKTIMLAVGEGFPYSTHQEFSVKRKDTA